jgi:putative transposase
MKLGETARKIEAHIAETFAYYAFPETHWRRIRTNNPFERMMREIRRRTRVVGVLPELMLAAARPRHVAGTQWGIKRYLSMDEMFKQPHATVAA